MRNNLWIIWWARFSWGGVSWFRLLKDGVPWARILFVGAVFLGLAGVVGLLSTRQFKSVSMLIDEGCFSPLKPVFWQQSLNPGELSGLLADNYFSTFPPPSSPVLANSSNLLIGSELTVFTTINEGLQHKLLKLLRRYHPQLGAGVLVNLKTGAIEAMAYYRHADEKGSILPQDSGNLCLVSAFPAASLFKIVTAYGVLERKGVTRHTRFPVVGRHHTLYKYQLGLGKSRYRYQPVEVSFEKAFARSVNPIFGKFGIDYFSAPELLQLAETFAFNRSLAFDLSVASSHVQSPETIYQRAETASGFIKTTTISPLHAALIAGAPLSAGKLKQPYIIDRVTAENGSELFYHQECRPEFGLADSKACAELVKMMQATVKYGTAKKSFQHLRKRRSFRNWEIGGKTGSLDMPDSDRRCEWFAGFAKDRKSDRQVAVSLVLVHGEKRTISSGYIAAEMLAGALK
ncbi:MAG: penicillin-binding transpeptidase domain-containing protein [Pseudomonadota bacterium]|nr:penicillin-binding transpeptidase domain-containing protein [Pseudomonadota bacterium]